jgi:hypothetical protein
MLYLLALIVAVLPIGAQVRFGVRGGMTVGELRFERDIIDSDNRMGWCGGLLIDAGIPVVGLGVEASVMYTHRNNRLTDEYRLFKRHYIEIPVYARYRLSLPSVERFFAPLVFTGPNFSILFNDNGPSTYDNSKTYLSWDVGAGADLFRHLRLTATYGIGISKAMKYINRDYDGEVVQGKDRYWTLNAAWLF